MDTPASLEFPQKIAFLILAHSDPSHLESLIQSLSGHDVYVHWDKKSGEIPNIPGATFIEDRCSVFWAGFTMVEATVALMRAARASNEPYIKYVLLSGADYPIRPLTELTQKFEADNDWNYLNAVKVDDSEHLSALMKQRLWRDGVLPNALPRTPLIKKIERFIRGSVNFLIPKIPKNTPDAVLYHGSQWWALSAAAVDTVIETFLKVPSMTAFYRFTFASDEQYVHTVIRNSALSSKCDPPLPYEGRGTYKTANLHIVDSSLTKWFSVEDKDQIIDSNKYFVRKLNSSKSADLVDWLDDEVLSTANVNVTES
jgi:hypothetical protein